MPSYSFVSSDGKGDPRFEALELEDSSAASRMARRFAREVMAADPAGTREGDFYSVKVMQDEALLFTVLTLREDALPARGGRRVPEPDVDEQFG